MKSILATLLFLAFSMTGVMAQSAAPGPNAPKFQFKKETHDFGTIPEGPVAEYTFEFKNTGKEPLIIQNASASCGCTTPEFKAGTYKAGETVKIKVGFNAAAAGPFNKPITITYNDGQQKVIFISGEVVTTPAAPAPGNGLSKIKQ